MDVYGYRLWLFFSRITSNLHSWAHVRFSKWDHFHWHQQKNYVSQVFASSFYKWLDFFPSCCCWRYILMEISLNDFLIRLWLQFHLCMHTIFFCKQSQIQNIFQIKAIFNAFVYYSKDIHEIFYFFHSSFMLLKENICKMQRMEIKFQNACEYHFTEELILNE